MPGTGGNKGAHVGVSGLGSTFKWATRGRNAFRHAGTTSGHAAEPTGRADRMPPDCRSAIPAVVPEPCFRGAPMATAPVERASSHGGHGPLGRAEALGARAGPALGAREPRMALHGQIEIVDHTDDPTPPLVWCRRRQPPAVRAATQPATPGPRDPNRTVLSPHPPDANNRKRPSKNSISWLLNGVRYLLSGIPSDAARARQRVDPGAPAARHPPGFVAPKAVRA